MIDEFDAMPYPIDFDALQKGDTIPVSVIEHVTSTKAGTDAFNLASLNLRNQIETRLAEREIPLYVVIESIAGALHICHDNRASLIAFQRVQQGSAAVRRNTIRMLRVDTGMLSADELNDHDRRMQIATIINAGLRDARKKAFRSVKPEAIEDKTA